MDNRNTIKPSLGATARGEAFYPRPREEKKIYQALSADTSIYLSAPRRVGKTSILRRLEDAPRDDNYLFIYVITESVYSVNDFFKELYEHTLKSEAIRKNARIFRTVTKFLDAALSRVQEVPGIVSLKDQPAADFHAKFLELLSAIEPGTGKLVVMIDEFPQTLHNIHKQHGPAEARRLLQLTRELRQRSPAAEHLAFILTGSISLFPMVEKIGALSDVNDLQTIEVKPLTAPEAADLVSRLLNGYKVAIAPQAIGVLLDTVKCFIPFHLQLICSELDDLYEDTELTADDVALAIGNAIDAKNKHRFAPYFVRLKGLLEQNEYDFAMDVLRYTAKNDETDNLYVNDCAVKHGITAQKEIMDMLCEDGYLYQGGNKFTYTSPILQLWCKKFNGYEL